MVMAKVCHQFFVKILDEAGTMGSYVTNCNWMRDPIMVFIRDEPNGEKSRTGAGVRHSRSHVAPRSPVTRMGPAAAPRVIRTEAGPFW